MFFLGTHAYYLWIKGKSYNYLQIKNVMKQGYFLLNKIMFLFFLALFRYKELNVVLLKGGEIENWLFWEIRHYKLMNGSRMVTQETWVWEAFSGHFSDLCFFFFVWSLKSRIFQSSWVQLIKQYISKRVQRYKRVYWWASACFHWSFRSFHLALSYLYHYFEIFGS